MGDRSEIERLHFSHEKHIIAGSAGLTIQDGILRLVPIMRYGLQVTGKPSPRICFIGTAGGDDATQTAAFYTACIGEAVTPSHLQLFSMPNLPDVRAHLLAVWRVHGLDVILREAWEHGVVLAGVSAGSVCWHIGGTTDSFGVELRPVTNGLGFLPYSNGVHYDSEERRRSPLPKAHRRRHAAVRVCHRRRSGASLRRRHASQSHRGDEREIRLPRRQNRHWRRRDQN